MKIHWRLINEYIKNADPVPNGCNQHLNCCPCLKDSKDCTNCQEGCVNYVGCGPMHRCKRPCKYCLYWTGYGLDYEDSLERDGVTL